MALNIKNAAAEDAVRRLTEVTGESQVEAVLRAVEERLARLTHHDRRARIAARAARAQQVYLDSGAALQPDALYDERGLPA